MQHEILKVTDVAELLQLSPRQILNLCREDAKKPIPHIRVNGRGEVRFRRSDVNAWFEKHLVSALG